jgi:hypothetical protein
MAKSIEQKAIDTLMNLVSDVRFREYEFISLMATQPVGLMRRFFGILLAFVEWYSISAEHNSYPGNPDRDVCQQCLIIREAITVNSNDYIATQHQMIREY